MTDALTTEPQAGQADGCAKEGGEAPASPPTRRPFTLTRAVAAHQLAQQGERDLAFWGKPGSGFTMLGRACFIGMVHVTSPEAVAEALEKLLAEVRGLPPGEAA